MTTNRCTYQNWCSLVKAADFNENGKLEFKEFLRLVIYEKNLFLNDANNKTDVNQKGWLTEAQVLLNISKAGHKVDGSVTNLVNKFARDGKINYNDHDFKITITFEFISY